MSFDYYGAGSVENAIEILSKLGDKGKVIAGGTDLLIGIERKKYSPKAVVDITAIPGIDKIELEEDGSLNLGAAVTNGDMCNAPENIKRDYLALVEACSQLGSPQVRNLATIGGNICNAAPSAETAPALIALGCNVKIVGPLGLRFMKIEDFFKGPSQNALEDFELLTEMKLPPKLPGSGSAYLRLCSRNALDIAVVNIGVFVKIDDNKKFEDVRICMGAVAPTPLRAFDAEKLLIGDGFSDKSVKEAGRLAKLYAVPISDVRATANYRKEMVSVLTEKALKIAYNRAIGKSE